MSEPLLVPLIILHGIEKSHVKPRLLVSLRLSRLRQLNKALALCPRDIHLFPRNHQRRRKNEGDEVDREISTHLKP